MFTSYSICVFRMCLFQRTRTIWFLPFPDNPVADSARAAVIVHSHLVDLEGWWKKHGWQQARTLKCKILLPKFNTWEQVHLERKKGSHPPFENAVGRFFAKNRCRYSVIASPLHRNGNTFWQKTDQRHFQRAEGYPFSALFAPAAKC